MMLKREYLSFKRSLNSAATGYDTDTEYYTASEYDHCENSPLSNAHQTFMIGDEKKLLRTCVVSVLRTWAY